MSERPTPETDALASEHRGAVIWPDFARRLERERDEAREELEWRMNWVKALRRVNRKLMLERDALQEQLDSALMLGKLQERRHERELEQVREQYRLSSVCRELKAENEQLKQQQP